MRPWDGALILLMVFFTCASCCMNISLSEPEPAFAPTVKETILTVEETIPAAVETTPESTVSSIPLSDLALHLSDLPEDYLLKDRSVIVSQEVSQLLHDLGWRQGYFASFYRINRKKEDFTSLAQSISIFHPETINRVFLIEKGDLTSPSDSSGTLNEIPFPATGDQSIAVRQVNLTDPNRQVVYTILFTRKNVYEKITMTGTTTDYETLKVVARKAADKIQ